VQRARKATERTERRGDRRIVLRRRVLVALAVPPADDQTPAIICDVSCKGIGLVAIVPLEGGTPVALAWEFGPRRTHRTVTATVVHAHRHRDGAWRVGCTFDTPLDRKEVRAFLRHAGKR
jgi:hypothetical protein